jgi:short-subunit dehydrogenase
MKAQGKVIVVTGGGSGMGRELTLKLLQKGASVAAVDINESTLEETARLAGEQNSRLSLHTVNITNQEATASLPETVIARHGAVDGLINNAGIIQPFVRFNELQDRDIERILNVNFWGVIHMTRAFLPFLLKRPEAHIVNTSSMGGFLPVPGQTIYGASKAAVKLFTEGLHSELLATQVHVTVVFPGAIATNITVNSGVSMQIPSADVSKIKMTSASDAAAMIIDGMEKNKYRVLVGSDAKMMDFLYRLMPERAARLIYTQMKAILP